LGEKLGVRRRKIEVGKLEDGSLKSVCTFINIKSSLFKLPYFYLPASNLLHPTSIF
jgi:hypothetical protein